MLVRAAWLGEPLGDFKNMNLDAFSRWVFELTSIDGLHRSLLYTPQHLFSYSLLLILVVLVLRGEPRGVGSSVLSGALLGGMAGTSIVTAMLAGPWLVWVRWSRGGSVRSRMVDLAVFGSVSLALLAWYFELGFFGDAGAALTLRRPQLLEIPALLLLECGPLLLLSFVAAARPAARPFLLLAGMAFSAILFLDIRGYEGVWMAWRAGSVLLISLMLLAAAGNGRWPPKALALVLASGSLTAALDLYNAQDVGNREMSRGDFGGPRCSPTRGGSDEMGACRNRSSSGGAVGCKGPGSRRVGHDTRLGGAADGGGFSHIFVGVAKVPATRKASGSSYFPCRGSGRGTSSCQVGGN